MAASVERCRNLVGFHSPNWYDFTFNHYFCFNTSCIYIHTCCILLVYWTFSYCQENEAKLIEDIVTDILGKLNLTPSKDFENFVEIEDHIAKMRLMLDFESMEVRTVGIWCPSGIGKTTIARVLFNQISQHFQGRIYIDRGFISKIKEDYNKGNPTDYNIRLHLQTEFPLWIISYRRH